MKNGLNNEIYEKSKSNFLRRLENVDFNKYHLETPFKDSGLALYNWSPIADELKILDKEIVLNSIKLKWNVVENEFKDLTKIYLLTNLYFVYSELKIQQQLDLP